MQEFPAETGALLLGVFDGHGSQGHSISGTLTELLPDMLATSDAWKVLSPDTLLLLLLLMWDNLLSCKIRQNLQGFANGGMHVCRASTSQQRLQSRFQSAMLSSAITPLALTARCQAALQS